MHKSRSLRFQNALTTARPPGLVGGAALFAWAMVSVLASAAGAFDLPPDSVLEVGGRLNYRIETSNDGNPFPWNYASRSVNDRSRLMLDLFTGRERSGTLYLKTAVRWAAPRTNLGSIRFGFEQGDYYFRRNVRGRSYELRLFANERRYFTHEMSKPSLLDDDVITSYDDQYGLRHDGGAGDVRWTAIAAVLGDVWKESQKFYYIRGGWFGSAVQASAAYVNSAPVRDTLQHHAVVKGELTAVYRRSAAVVSYEQSGFDDGAFFVPSGSDDCQPSYYSAGDNSLPENSALYAELRLLKLPIKNTGLWSLIGHYQSLGGCYANNLGASMRGETEAVVGLYYSAIERCIDGRVEYEYRDRSRFDDKNQHRTEASARGLLANGFEVTLRGAQIHTVDELGVTTDDGYGYASVRRYGRKVDSAIYVMLQNDPNDGLEDRLGIEARINLTGSVSWYGRLITTERATSSDAVFSQFEIRPTEYLFAVIGYGRDYIGDEPFVLTDPDIGQRDQRESVLFVSVRGDF